MKVQDGNGEGSCEGLNMAFLSCFSPLRPAGPASLLNEVGAYLIKGTVRS